ncbi:MAG: hypothetical protein COC16_00150 [Lutibacter sp.]|nr:MAG: hypothetical protein COC16_00150 [Lutibacter sp.]
MGLGDWLGTDRVANFNKKYKDFNEAREYVRGLGIESNKKWREYCVSGEKPDDIPANPDRSYKNKGWLGYGDWLCTGRFKVKNKID